MKFNNDEMYYNVIEFIVEEMNTEDFLENIFNSSLTDEELEEKLIEYTNMIIREIQTTLKVSFEYAKTLYENYLVKDII